MSERNNLSTRKMAAAAFAFGQNKTTGLGTSTTPGFSFGTPGGVGSAFTASTPSTISFGATNTAATTPATALTFGGLSTSKPTTLGFGQSSTASTGTLKLGSSSATTTASNVLSLSNLQTVNPGTSGGLFGAAKTTVPGLSLGTAAVKPTSALTLNLGGTSANTGLFGGLSSTTNTGLTTTTNTTSTITGLGGTGTSATVSLSGNVSGISGKQSEIQNLKDNQVPQPLILVMEDIKKYIKQQKDHRDEIARFSASNIQKVQEETLALRQSLSVVSNSIQRDACAVENLKMDVAQELKNAEIAQHTSEIPPALQHENVAPQEYFARLVESFEERMQIYRKQIEIMESHLASLSQGQTVTPQDLSLVMHKVHDTFIALAAQLHSIHEAVKVQKEHYLNYRKAYFKDNTDIFISNGKISTRPSYGLTVGPSPFNNVGTSSSIGSSKMHISGPGTSGLGTTTAFGSSLTGSSLNSSIGAHGTSTGFGSGLGLKSFGTQSTGTTGFGFANQGNKTGFGFGTPSNNTPGNAFGNPAQPNAFGTLPKFELKKPPTGNKRGKKR